MDPNWSDDGDGFDFPADPDDFSRTAEPLNVREEGAGIPFAALVSRDSRELPPTVLPAGRPPNITLGGTVASLLTRGQRKRGPTTSARIPPIAGAATQATQQQQQQHPSQASQSATATQAAPTRGILSPAPAVAAASPILASLNDVAPPPPPPPLATEPAVLPPGSMVENRWTETRKVTHWTAEETLRFFTALQQFGTDFSLISVLFPGRGREEIRRKFRLEERRNAERIAAALAATIPIDEEAFEQGKAEWARLEREPPAQLNEAEQTFLAELDAAAGQDAQQQQQRVDGERGTAAGAIYDDGDFSFDGGVAAATTSLGPPAATAAKAPAKAAAKSAAAVDPDDLPLTTRFAPQLNRSNARAEAHRARKAAASAKQPAAAAAAGKTRVSGPPAASEASASRSTRDKSKTATERPAPSAASPVQHAPTFVAAAPAVTAVAAADVDDGGFDLDGGFDELLTTNSGGNFAGVTSADAASPSIKDDGANDGMPAAKRKRKDGKPSPRSSPRKELPDVSVSASAASADKSATASRKSKSSTSVAQSAGRKPKAARADEAKLVAPLTAASANVVLLTPAIVETDDFGSDLIVDDFGFANGDDGDDGMGFDD